MKVSTDSILLGAWADVSNATRILDIGTGSGILALMLAQKSSADIVAIEIESEAAHQAKDNASQSPWADKLQICNCDIAEFSAPKHSFDVVISNPPYFKAGQHFGTKRQLARHDESLDLAQLLHYAAQFLAEKGSFYLVLPNDSLATLERLLVNQELHLTAKTSVASFAEKQPYCCLLKLSKDKQTLIENNLIIYQSPGTYSEEFKALTSDYYLNF